MVQCLPNYIDLIVMNTKQVSGQLLRARWWMDARAVQDPEPENGWVPALCRFQGQRVDGCPLYAGSKARGRGGYRAVQGPEPEGAPPPPRAVQ